MLNATIPCPHCGRTWEATSLKGLGLYNFNRHVASCKAKREGADPKPLTPLEDYLRRCAISRKEFKK